MPFSSERGKDYVKKIVGSVPHATILDIGAGCGTYALMFDDADMTAVEIWEPYVEKYNLHSLYDDVIIADAREWDPGEKRYDVAIAGDVLEHMTLEEAYALFQRLRRCADTVVVSIPLGHYPQGEYDGNPHEAHVTDHWTHSDVLAIFGEPDTFKIDGEIGVYIWSKHKVKPKICVYAISKNEEQFVKRFCASAADADLILIADTGSTDATADLARECGAAVYNIHVRPWRFDIARNAALALVPADIDVCISLDLDEVLEPGWREEIEGKWELGKTTNLWYLFDWGCGISFPYRKIHSRHGYHWHHPCHEDLRIDARVQEVKAHSNKLLVSHHPDPNKSRGQYMEILEAAVAEDDRDPSHFFYYARELTFYQRWAEAIVALHKYLSMGAPSNQNERCYAMRLLGKSYNESGEPQQAEKWFYAACAEAPNTREPWCELALLMYTQHRWEECFAASMRALKITDRQLVYTCDPAVWGHWPHDLASISAWHMGLREISLRHAEAAVELSPDDPRLRANLEFVRGDVASLAA